MAPSVFTSAFIAVEIEISRLVAEKSNFESSACINIFPSTGNVLCPETARDTTFKLSKRASCETLTFIL